nr:MAG TPA: hypothetical protein [Caudoviricetes sp.]
MSLLLGIISSVPRLLTFVASKPVKAKQRAFWFRRC